MFIDLIKLRLSCKWFSRLC